jgi:hypothetical protein
VAAARLRTCPSERSALMDDGRDHEIETSSAAQAGTAASQAPKRASRRPAKVTAVWVIAALGGVFVFAAGLFAIAHPITDDPSMGFFVEGDHGQPVPSTFPAQGGLFCETPLMSFGFYPTCATVDANVVAYFSGWGGSFCI